jgi:uncharacterized membrane protein
MDLTGEIIVNIPLEAAFAYYADQARLQEWVPGGSVLEFTPLTAPPKRPGSRYRMAYKSLGKTFNLVAELTALEPNRRSAMDQVTGDYRVFHYEMQFDAVTATTTRMKMRINATLPWGMVGTIADLLSRPLAIQNLRKTLQRFKAGAERVYGALPSAKTSGSHQPG